MLGERAHTASENQQGSLVGPCRRSAVYAMMAPRETRILLGFLTDS